MTPAIRLLEKSGVTFTVHPYKHEDSADSFGQEAAQALGVAPERMFKTLVARLDGEGFILALVPVGSRLDLKRLAAAYRVKKAEMADPAEAERVTGYIVGGISPLGGKKRLPAIADETIKAQQTVYVSAGRRGLQLELAPVELLRLTNAVVGAIAG